MTSPAVETTSPRAPRLRAFWMLASGLALIAIAAFAGVSAMPAWCSSCHAMRPFAAGLRATPHASVACRSCHGPSPGTYASLVARQAGAMAPRFLVTLGRARVTGAKDPVPDAGCRRCHADVSEGVVSVRGVRIRHSTCAPGSRSCVDCHATASHGSATRAARGYTMDGCVRCHDGEQVSADCDLCHVEKLPADRIARGPWSVTHGAQWQRTHGLGDLDTCRVCHPASKCRGCHGVDLPHAESFPRVHGAEAKRVKDQCAKCHDEKAFCSPCHGTTMPHPDGFLSQHPRAASGYDDPGCARCHPRETCDACHAAHAHPGSTRGKLGGVALPKADD